MPYAIVMPLVPVDATPLPRSLGVCAHAALFELLREIDPALAAALHGSDDRKPFSMAVLRARPAAGAAPAPILRLCLLDDSLFEPIVGGLLKKDAAFVRLGEAKLTVQSVLTHRDAHPLAGLASYTELSDQSIAVERLVVRFVTPTVFKSQGRDILWPDPRLLLQSWVRAWNAYAGATAAMDEQLLVAGLSPGLHIVRQRIETRRISLGDGIAAGFVGDVTLDLRAAQPYERRRIAALAGLSFYSGTGRKTAMGMGQTRPIGRLTGAGEGLTIG